MHRPVRLLLLVLTFLAVALSAWPAPDPCGKADACCPADRGARGDLAACADDCAAEPATCGQIPPCTNDCAAEQADCGNGPSDCGAAPSGPDHCRPECPAFCCSGLVAEVATFSAAPLALDLRVVPAPAAQPAPEPSLDPPFHPPTA